MARTRRPRGAIFILVAVSVIAQTAVAAAESGDPCQGAEVMKLPTGTIGCTHGPDPLPEGAPPIEPRLLQPAAAPTVTCVGDGSSGNRVQALYVVAADRPNRADVIIPQIRQWIADVDSVFSASSAGHGVDMTVRWVHDADCVVDVDTVVIPAGDDDGFFETINALGAAGYAQPGRHYLTWVDASVYCGIAVNYPDDSYGQGNLNNGDWPLWARVDRDCWGRSGLVESHELTHLLGAVQASAPNSTTNGHCTDEYDIMCYPDGGGATMTITCPDTAEELQLDCNDDDYFNPDPPPGSYLDTHWNVARSSFLNRGDPRDTPETLSSDFDDITSSNPFRSDIEWLAGRSITRGCNPPTNDRFCPDDPVTRGQMAAFLVRALGLEDIDPRDPFEDDDGSAFEADIETLAESGITTGCGGDDFCPDEPITRGQMAAFLTRALGLVGSTSGDPFDDDDDSVFESDIELLAAAGITTGCGGEDFCPDDPVTRAQMAAFLKRALG